MEQKAKCLDYSMNSGLLFSIGLLLPGHQPCNGLLLSFLFAQHPLFYWDIIDMQHCVSLRYIMWSFDTCMYCKIFTMTRLVNTSFTSHNYHFFQCLWWWYEWLRCTLLAALKSTMCVVSCSVVSNCLWPHGLYPARLLCPWNFPGKNTGVSCHFLLQGIRSS